MSYEFDGVKYKEASTHQNEWGCKLISELGLAGNERILDLGCGLRWFTPTIEVKLCGQAVTTLTGALA